MFLFLEPTYHPGRSPSLCFTCAQKAIRTTIRNPDGGPFTYFFAYVGKGSHTQPTFLLKGKPYLFSQEEDGIFISRRGIFNLLKYLM